MMTTTKPKTKNMVLKDGERVIAQGDAYDITCYLSGKNDWSGVSEPFILSLVIPGHLAYPPEGEDGSDYFIYNDGEVLCAAATFLDFIHNVVKLGRLSTMFDSLDWYLGCLAREIIGREADVQVAQDDDDDE